MESSEVAQLRRRIDAEIIAMNEGLYGYAEVARHHIIEHKYTQLGTYHEQLSALIGPTEAIQIMIDALNTIESQPHELPSCKKDTHMSHFD